MRQIREVKLELLRQGDPQNQLLSPLTRYLALAGDHEACIVNVPFKHQDFLVSLRSLRYEQQDDATRRAQLNRMGEDMAKILGGIPGLIADLGAAAGGRDTLTHLRLVFSAAELALLPFELATAPRGFPGEGARLALQFQAPLVITREVRAASSRRIEWSKKPKVLFAYAAPRDDIPEWLVNAHMQALRRAVAPFANVRHSKVKALDGLDEFLRVLPEASCRSIEGACSEASYTHVHILAHGATVDEALSEQRFGLVLHGDSGGADHVDGLRLATALRAHSNADDRDQISSRRLSHPMVVSVAACDSGQQGSVLVPGSSLAHSLHEAGVPLVVASQFPLTFAGSLQMASVLYQRLLWGDDPRVVLHDLRQRLKGLGRDNHDWASLVCHAALPVDLETQSMAVRSDRVTRAVNAANAKAWVDLEQRKGPRKATSKHVIESHMERLDRAIVRSPALEKDFENEARDGLAVPTEVLSLHGKAYKRKAELLWYLWWQKESSSRAKKPERPWDVALRQALAAYERAWALNPNNAWAGIECFSLSRYLEDRVEVDLWHTLSYVAGRNLSRYPEGHSEHGWAGRQQLELYFHALYTPALEAGERALLDLGPTREARDNLMELARRFVSSLGLQAQQVIVAGAQFQRFEYWWKLGRWHEKLAKDLKDTLWGHEPPGKRKARPAAARKRKARKKGG